jgi:hypothetical protein
VRATVALLALALAAGCAGRPALLGLEPAARDTRLAGDQAAVRRYREGMRAVVTYLDARPDLFPPGRPTGPRLLPAADREAVRDVWRRFLDYVLALDALAKDHDGFDRLPPPARYVSGRIAHAAFVGQYRFALDFLDRTSRDPDLDVLLNEPVPELGLPAGTYVRVKYRFLNVIRATQFAAWAVVARDIPADVLPGLAAGIAEDSAALWQAGRGRGPQLTAENALRVVQRAGVAAWFPVQAGVAEWMGDTRTTRRPPLVSPDQITHLRGRLEPGDILLERREWYLSNIGLPGFWPHAALYVGTPADRRMLAAHPDVRRWAHRQGEADSDLEALLRQQAPAAYAASLTLADGHARRVLEAISEGVVFTSLEHSAAADALAVLRPRLSPVERAAALVRAFSYAGRPYDFDFDFRTDGALVCTELVYKAYEAALRLPLVELLGRPVLPANELVRRFDAEVGTPAQQFDLVLFLDGPEAAGLAVERSVDEFRQSWRRPKWRVAARD